MTPEPKLCKPIFDLLVIWTVRIVAVASALFGFLTLITLILSLVCTSPGYSPLGRAATEIKALEAALEAYKADHGHYPYNAPTEQLVPDSPFGPATYIETSACLYEALAAGTPAFSAITAPLNKNHGYYSFQPKMLRKTQDGRTYLVDPWGNSYGYSTFQVKYPGRTGGHSLDYELWSTANGRTAQQKDLWIKSW